MLYQDDLPWIVGAEQLVLSLLGFHIESNYRLNCEYSCCRGAGYIGSMIVR